MARRKRKESIEEDLFKAIFGVIALLVIYLAFLYYTNRADFYHWLTYGITICVLLVFGTIVWAILIRKMKKRRFFRLLTSIRSKGLESDVSNFITRFGRGQERTKNAWEYRGYKIDWSRINEVMEDFKHRGVQMTHKDFSAILKYYIDGREGEYTIKSIRSDVHSFSALNGTTFEHLLQRLYEKMGYTAQLTGQTGDQGGDLVAIRGQERLLIQAKCYREDVSVGNKAVQEAVAAMKYYDCNKAIVATTSRFTQSAIELARANDVDLLSRQHLQEMLLQHLSESWK